MRHQLLLCAITISMTCGLLGWMLARRALATATIIGEVTPADCTNQSCTACTVYGTRDTSGFKSCNAIKCGSGTPASVTCCKTSQSGSCTVQTGTLTNGCTGISACNTYVCNINTPGGGKPATCSCSCNAGGTTTTTWPSINMRT